MATPKFKATVGHDGKPHLSQPKYFANYMKTFNNGDIVEITVKKWKDNRTTNQNSYLWGVVYKTIGDYTGNSPDDIHAYMVDMFLSDKDRVIPKRGSTTKLSTVEFSEYLEKIFHFAATELGVAIAPPDEIET